MKNLLVILVSVKASAYRRFYFLSILMILNNGFEGVDIGVLKLFLLLYADDIVIFSETDEGLQSGLDILYKYCQTWKLKVNINKTKVIVFRKGGLLPQNIYTERLCIWGIREDTIKDTASF